MAVNLVIPDPLEPGFLALEWAIRIAMLMIVPLRRTPDAARGWLLLVFFLPIPGLLLYLLIGRPTFPRWRRRRFVAAKRLIETATQEIVRSRQCCSPRLPANLTSAALLIERLGQFPTLGGNAVELLSGYNDVVARLIDDISSARDHVHIVMYIFADDEVGGRVADALLEAAGRGVCCRVLIDAIGSRPWASRLIERLSAGGVEIARALPVAMLRRRSTRTDLRNHRKMIIVDGRFGYIGSQNLVAADISLGVGNQELVARVGGPIVLELQAVFSADWFLETGRMLQPPSSSCQLDCGSVVAQLLPSGPDYPVAGAERLIVALIHGARSRIVIVTPYFIPDESLTEALQTAVLRGVAVQIILSRAMDHWLVNFAQRSYYEQLLGFGASIHLFRHGLLHAKHISVDDEICLIGSTNIDIRSFLLNAEASLALYDRGVVEALRVEQVRVLAGSDPLTLQKWEKRPTLVKLTENIARLFSPLL